MSEIEDLRKDVSRIEIKVEQVLTEIQPMCKLYRGNGKPGIDVRMSLAEDNLIDMKESTKWATRTALTAIISAAGTALWYIITKNQ